MRWRARRTDALAGTADGEEPRMRGARYALGSLPRPFFPPLWTA